MDFVIDQEFQSHLRKLTKAERNRLKSKIEHEGCRDQAITIAEIDGKRFLIDGHNTVDICRELKKPLGKPVVITLPTREAALEWIEWNQEARRNASQEEMEAARARRIPLVVEAKQEGKSNRTIAEEHGVSEKQVREDLKKAGAEGYAPEPKTQKVQGKDGKEYPATKPASSFCPRCQRVGPVKDCPACKELKSASKPSNGKPPKAPKPGSVKYDWNASDKQFGAVARWPDQVASAYPGEKQSNEYKKVIALLTELGEVRKGWHKRLQKIGR